MKLDEQERTALADAGFAVADDSKAAYAEASLVIRANDDETYRLTIALPNETRIICVMPRDQMMAAITDEFAPRRVALE